MSGRWKATDSFEMFASVLNVTDKIAPLDPLTYGAVNYNPLHFSGADRPLLHGGSEVQLQLSRSESGKRKSPGMPGLFLF